MWIQYSPPAIFLGGIISDSNGWGDSEPLSSLLNSFAASLVVSVAAQKKGADSVHSICNEDGIIRHMRAPSTFGST